MMQRNAPRQIRRTVLIVGEGLAEVEFLTHLRALYTAGQQGCRLTVKNARGRGAGHVVKHAIGQRAQASYDRAAAMLDTDTDWTVATQSLARRNNIKVLACDPCLEAWLLRLAGQRLREGIDAGDAKARFAALFGGGAHDNGVIARHFTREVLDAAAINDPLLSELFDLILNW